MPNRAPMKRLRNTLLTIFFWAPWVARADGLDWYVVNNLGDSIFPSFEIATATLSPNQKMSRHLQSLLVRVVVPSRQTDLLVTVAANKFLHESKTEEQQLKPGVHFIPLKLLWDIDALLAVAEPRPEAFTFRILVNGQPAGERSLTYEVRSINDCLRSFTEPLSKRQVETYAIFAAYVDENEPTIDRILHEALRQKLLPSFPEKTKDRAQLMRAMSAVWTVLQSLGVKYSSIARESALSHNVASQHVRLFGDSVSNSEANCVDGSALLASIFVKLGWGHPFLVLIPGHCYLGVDFDSGFHDTLCVETTMIGSRATFQSAVQKGDQQFARDLPHIQAREAGFRTISIDQARRAGIQALPEPKGSEPVLNFAPSADSTSNIPQQGTSAR